MIPAPAVVDLHHHWMPRTHFENPEPHLRSGQVALREPGRVRILQDGIQYFGPREICCDLARQVEDMDRSGVDIAVLHLGCWQEWLTMKTARFVNEAMAEEIEAFPGRFLGLAHVPPLESGATEELERAVNQLGFRGVGITSSVCDRALDSPELEPFYRKVCDLGVPLVVHPISAPMAASGLKEFHLTRSLGRVFEMALATTRLLHSGILGKFPDLRFAISHLGGAFFAIKRRLAPDYYAGAPEDLFERYMNQIYFDTAPPFWGPTELKAAIDILGTNRVVLGSDYPIVLDLSRAKSSVENLPVPPVQRRAILGGNALVLFGLEESLHAQEP